MGACTSKLPSQCQASVLPVLPFFLELHLFIQKLCEAKPDTILRVPNVLLLAEMDGAPQAARCACLHVGLGARHNVYAALGQGVLCKAFVPDDQVCCTELHHGSDEWVVIILIIPGLSCRMIL